jgi:folate-binding protein YgfZ
MNNTLNGMAPLPHLGVIRAEGEDAAKFLHGQLTQDFALLGLSEARLAAFCSAKGRMQASFVAFKRSHTEILLICSRDLLAQALKRLSMFVLRAKVKLSDATEGTALCGVAGPALQALAAQEARPWTCQALGEAHLVHLYPSDGVPRALWVAPAGTALPAGPALRHEDWLWGEVRSGVATVSQPIFEAFVPQMLNYESVGGVNFKKGCYPGQEVVARSQFRGTLKRRGYLVHGETAMQAGQDIYAATDPEQPCGLVAQAAPAPQGGWEAIVSLQTASAQAVLHLGQADGPVLTLLPLPYPLLEDI